VKSPKSQIEGLLGEKHQIFLCFFLYLCLGFNPLQAEKPRFVDITADVGIVLNTQEELTSASYLPLLGRERLLLITIMMAI